MALVPNTKGMQMETPADYAQRVYRRFATAPNETRLREAVNFVECLARVEYWPSHNLESPWVMSVIDELRNLDA
jgi:hypothetical protein